LAEKFARSEGFSARRRRALLAAALLTIVAALLASPGVSRADEKCADGNEYTFCKTTEKNGTYTLIVPKGDLLALLEPAFAPYKDCTWSVLADFGDETTGDYVWDAEIGLTASHKFPAPGSYIVTVDATEGTHNQSGEPCPDLHLTAYVTYPEPVEEPPEEEPEEPGEEGPPLEENPGGGGPTQSAGAQDAPGQLAAGTRSSPYWSRCGRGILAHRVRCRRARAVMREARPSLAQGLPAPVHVLGFSCHLRPNAKRTIACRRGERRILAP
jgi:hypothetical protein